MKQAGDRIITLDVIRGIAVMGILVANMPAFALPGPAYFSPLAWGGTSPADQAVWLTTFVLIEGKMRGLFSFLFGASMLLVIDRAEESGQSAAKVHFSRMAVLLLIGLAHMYLVWWGDILAHYALVGTAAFLFIRLDSARLLAMSAAFLVTTLVLNSLGLFALIGAANGHNPDLWNSFAEAFGVPSGPSIPNEIAAMRGSWSDQLAWRWQHLEGPFAFLQVVGPETLSAMLLGMAAYRSGFLTGEWSGSHYRRCALIGLGVALPAYLLLGIATMAHGFDQRWVYFGSIVGSVPFRLLGVVGYAAAIILLLRPASALSKRLSAVGRAAFTNYLGTSVLVTGIFYGWGLGLYATLSRAQIYLVPPVVWLLMLAWSKPWLDRFRYGPFEWVWRSAARGKLQPMRKQSSAPALAR